jgi:hypothetical protein
VALSEREVAFPKYRSLDPSTAGSGSVLSLSTKSCEEDCCVRTVRLWSWTHVASTNKILRRLMIPLRIESSHCQTKRDSLLGGVCKKSEWLFGHFGWKGNIITVVTQVLRTTDTCTGITKAVVHNVRIFSRNCSNKHAAGASGRPSDWFWLSVETGCMWIILRKYVR